MTAAITWSEILVSIHILAVVVAFGGALAYPYTLAAAGSDGTGGPNLDRRRLS